MDWVTELRRRIERSDDRFQFLWAAFAAVFAGVWLLATQAFGLFPGELVYAWWLIAIGCAVYLLVGTSLAGNFFNSNTPSWAPVTRGFHAELMARYVAKYGAPKAARALAWHHGVLFLLFSGLLMRLAYEASGAVAFLGFIIGVNFLLSAAGQVLPFYANRKFLELTMRSGVQKFTDIADHPTHELPEGTRTLKGIVKLAVSLQWIGNLGFLGIALWLSPLGAWDLLGPTILPSVALVGAVALGFGSTRVLLLLVVDQSRALVEQLHHEAFMGTITADRIHRMLHVIEAFRRTHYILNLPIHVMIKDLDIDTLDFSTLIQRPPHELQ